MKINNVLFAFFFPCFIIFFPSKNIFAQDNVSDSTFYQKALFNTIAIYHQAFVNQPALYNGSKYGGYLFGFDEGHPYFNLSAPAPGSVIYDGIRYDSVMMRYDEVADVLIVSALSEQIQLHGKRVAYFKLYNSDFIRLENDSLNNGQAPTGFYNVLYQGKIYLLKKQVKSIREVVSSNVELQHFVDTKDYYYLKIKEEIYPIKSKKKLYQLFADHRKELQQFVKVNKLNFRKDRQNMITRTTAYYDSLKK